MKSSSSARTRRHPSGGSGGRVVFGCLHLSSITFAAALCIMITLLRLHSLGRFAAPPMSSRATTSIGEGLANTEGRTPSVWDEVRRSASFDSNDTVLPHAPYRPTWKRWRMHMFHALDDDLLAEGSCVGWRQTMLCSPDGPIEPHFSRPCKTVVTSGSGYCLCKHGRRVNQVGCGAVHFTCAEACSGIPSSRKSESDASGSSGGNQEQPALMLRQGKMLEEIEARGRDIKRRLLAQRSLLAVIYPPIVQEQHPKNENESAEDVAVKRSKANNTSGNDTNVPPPKKTHAPPQQQDVVDHVVEAEVARRKREAAWKATMKEYDRWTKQWYDAKVQQSARDLGDSVCVGWRSSSDC
ncbi:membrane-associated protein, putative, partial [Bodo saltans]